MIRILAVVLILSFLCGGRTPEQKRKDREQFQALKWQARDKWGQIVWPVRLGLILAILYFVL